VRVVKGQWEDATSEEVDPRNGVIALVERLADRVPKLAIATHDVALLREALPALATSEGAGELELLLGMPIARPIALARREGIPARCYVPYGNPRPPYEPSDAARNLRVAWRFARDLVWSTLGGAGHR
jgi:proline dehydrogenase